MRGGCRVIKVGGSLFNYGDLSERIDRWLAAQTACHDVLIPGGGQLADAVRDFDKVHRIGDERGHWMCVQLLDVAAQLVHQLVRGSRLVRDFGELRECVARPAAARWVLSVEDFLRHHEPQLAGSLLPHDWRSSSDAIAARVAHALNAIELVLLKSCDPPEDKPSLTDAAACGLIDQAMPEAAGGLEVRWVNLRSWK